MKASRGLAACAGALALFVALVMGPAGAETFGFTENVSRTAASGDANGSNVHPSINRSPDASVDGRFVAFESGGTNLVPEDTDSKSDIYVRDTKSPQMTFLVSKGTLTVHHADGSTSKRIVKSNGKSTYPVISESGRFVAFVSTASNLVGDIDEAGNFLPPTEPGMVARDSGLYADVFVHDRDKEWTYRVSESTRGVEGNGSSAAEVCPQAKQCDHSAEPNYALRMSSAPAIGGEGDTSDCERPDALACTSGWPIVAYSSEASNLVNNFDDKDSDANGETDVFVHNLNDGHTARASLASARPDNVPPVPGQEGDKPSYQPSVSRDGKIVSYTSESTLAQFDDNIACAPFLGDPPAPQSNCPDVYRYDLETLQTTLISVAPNLHAAAGGSVQSAISSDGSFVAFASTASNFVFRSPARTERCQIIPRVTPSPSPAPAGTPAPTATPISICVGDKVDTNGVSDVYMRDLVRGVTSLISISADGASAGNLPSELPVISDVRPVLPSIPVIGALIDSLSGVVAFRSEANNLGTETGGGPAIFARDLAGQNTELMSVSSTGRKGPGSDWPSISADGDLVAFASETQLDASDHDNLADVYLHNRGVCTASTSENGTLSKPVHETIEPGLGPAKATVHDANCEYIRGQVEPQLGL